MPSLYLVIKIVKVNVTANPLLTAIILPGHTVSWAVPHIHALPGGSVRCGLLAYFN
jgi:hypothetical protein